MGRPLVAASVAVLDNLVKRRSNDGACDRLTRRAFARVAVWAAAGASFLAGSRRGESAPHGAAEPAIPTSAELGLGRLAEWARLGRAWRELNSLSREPDPDLNAGLSECDTLQPKVCRLDEEMKAAPDDLDAWPELRHLVEERVMQLHHHYERGKLRSTPPAKVADERVVELTVDKLGWLTGAGSANGTLDAEPLTDEGHTEAEHGP